MSNRAGSPLSPLHARLAERIARHLAHDGEIRTAVDSLYLSRRSSPTLPLYTAQWPCLALVAQGAKSLELGRELYHYGPGDYLLVSLDLPVVSRTTQASAAQPLLGLGLALNPLALDALLARTGVPPAALDHDAGRGVAVRAAPAALLEAVLRLLDLLDRPDDIPALAPLLEQEILYHLLRGPDGARLLRSAADGSPSNRVARAMAWLRTHYREPLQIAALAAEVGMSSSSLHHHFKAVAAMTPMQYQKQLRLHEARRLLLVDGIDVGQAALRVGYQSLSQFGLEYRRLYGATPLRDIAAARGAGGYGRR